MDHAVAFAQDKVQKDKVKEKKQAFNKRKKEFYDNDRSTRIKAAQKAFNDFIRFRDDELPCISCGRFHAGQYHAGHYRTTGAHPELRFEESNCHKQCSACNNYLSGNITEYRIHLIRKVGLSKVGWLEGPHEPKKYTCADLKEIELYYKAKLKELLNSDTNINN